MKLLLSRLSGGLLGGLLCVASIANADGVSGLPSHRVVFEIPKDSGSISKMQVDVFENNKPILAFAKCLGTKGEIDKVQLVCNKKSKTEFSCRRGDNGGGFGLVVAPVPRISIGYFSADREDAEKEILVLRSTNEKLITVDGKTATISAKDLF